jgi:hypothetical protein
MAAMVEVGQRFPVGVQGYARRMTSGRGLHVDAICVSFWQISFMGTQHAYPYGKCVSG